MQFGADPLRPSLRSASSPTGGAKGGWVDILHGGGFMEKTISFFSEFYDAVKFLKDEDFGAVMRAAMEYQISGKEYSGDNPFVQMGFNFSKSQADRIKNYSEQKRANANKRWAKQTDAERESRDTEEYTGMQNDANECKPMQTGAEDIQTDAPIPFPIPDPIPDIITSLSNAGANGENFAGEPQKQEEPTAPAKQTRKAYGSFCWVKLTDKEYAALVNDLGQAEAERCIAYVDECAQSTGNKNKWRDWNLVVRKCSRDKWGVSAPKITFQGRQRPERPGDIHGCSEPGPAELEAIARVLREPQEDFQNWNRGAL